MIYKFVNRDDKMENLMKPAEYAQALGISRQAVYAKIKKGILQSKNVEGKLYIVVDKEMDINKPERKKQSTSVDSSRATKSVKEYTALLQAKDETIAVLKETVVDLKESNKQVSTTLRSEIDLLKEAFYEMRTMYAKRLEHKQVSVEEDTIEVDTEVEEEQWIGIKKFFKLQDIHKKKWIDKLTKRFKKAYKKGDDRFMKVGDKLKLNINREYKDIVN